MGYYVSTERSDISICDKDLFVECVKRMFSPENIAKYGETYSWGDDGSVVKSLKFIDPDDVRMAFIKDSVVRIFDLFGYSVDECGDGSIQISKDGKWGDDELFFSTIAPAIGDDSYVDIVGECGERWRYEYHEGVCYLRECNEVKWVFDPSIKLKGL
jgi:hypothetical protein